MMINFSKTPSLLLLLIIQTAFAFVAKSSGGIFSSSRQFLTKSDEEKAVQIFKNKFEGSRKNVGIDEIRLTTGLNSLAKVVGDDNAMKMAEADPKVLEFKSTNFQAVFDAYCTNLGEEEATGMVIRNPALMGVPPSGYGGADKAGKDAVVVSYVIAATRPLGGLWLGLLFLVLATPAIEGVTGVQLRASFLPDIFRELKFID